MNIVADNPPIRTYDKAINIIMSSKARSMVVERGKEDWDSDFDRFPRLFNGYQEIPGLTWPTTTFAVACVPNPVAEEELYTNCIFE